MISHEETALALSNWIAEAPQRNFPKISVVTPSFNQGRYLEETIRSVIGQAYPSLEYVIVDGKSNDGSEKVIGKYSEHLHWWISEEDSGPEQAINKGFSHTSGDIMAWIGSSDKYLPWAFTVVAHIFEQFPEVDWLTTLYPVQWDQLGRVSGIHFLPAYHRRNFFRGEYLNVGGFPNARGWIQAESTFWRRSLWERSGAQLDPGKHASDFDLWARFFRHAKLWGVLAPLGGWRLASSQRGRGDEEAYLESSLSVLERYGKRPAPEALDLRQGRWHAWLKRMGLAPSGPVLLPMQGQKAFTKSRLFIESKYEAVSPSIFGLEKFEDLQSET